MLVLLLGLEHALAEELVEQALRQAGRLDVLPVQEDAARLEQLERLLVERALALVRQVVDREARDDGVVAVARPAGRRATPASTGRRARSPSGPPCRPGGSRAAASIGSEKSTSTPVDVGVGVQHQLGEAAVARAQVAEAADPAAARA